MEFSQIIQSIKARQFMPIYFLHGEEAYYIDAIADIIETHLLNDMEKAFNQVICYGKEVDFKQVVDNARQFPMMASHRLVMIKEAQSMRDLDKLESYFQSPSPQTVLVICHKYKKLDGRSKIAKILKKNAVVFESKKIRDYQVGQWISSEINRLGYAIDTRSASLLGEYLGTDLSKISNEINKLIIDLPKGAEIDSQLIQDMVGISKDYNIFEFQNAIGSKNLDKARLITNYFKSNLKKDPLVMILGVLYNYFTKVFITSSNASKSDQEIAKMIRLPNAYFMKDYRLAARNFPRIKLFSIFEMLKKTDARSKGVGTAGASDADLLEELVFHIFH